LPLEPAPSGLEKVGVRSITILGQEYRIPWYKIRADYNFIETAAFWAEVPCPEGTKTTYVGLYGDIRWCEWGDFGEVLVSSVGVLFSVPDHFRVKPGPGEVNVRWWLHEERRTNGMAFQDDRYYVFCLDRAPMEQWRNLANEPACDMDTELAHVIGIIAIEPTFDFTKHPHSEALYVTQDSLLSVVEEYSYGNEYKQGLAVTRTGDTSFHLETSGEKTVTAPPEFVQRMLYALNTCSWRRENKLHKFEISPPVMRTLVTYKDKSGKTRKVTIEYDYGFSYLTQSDTDYYSTPHPYLWYEVQRQAQELCGY
jgi:hypothetical protein